MILQNSDLVQGSQAWIDFRGGGIGGSEASALLGIGNKSRDQLFLEKTGQALPPDLSKAFPVIRGQALEPLARNLINSLYVSEFEPVVFVSDELPFMIYSSDGFDKFLNELIEIKCPMEKGFSEFKETKKIRPEYFCQCQWALGISRCELLRFFCYSPEGPLEETQVFLNERFFNKLKKEAKIFWSEVTQYRKDIYGKKENNPTSIEI